MALPRWWGLVGRRRDGAEMSGMAVAHLISSVFVVWNSQRLRAACLAPLACCDLRGERVRRNADPMREVALDSCRRAFAELLEGGDARKSTTIG
jgi:hypothetical protein